MLTALESALPDEAVIMLEEDETFDINVITQKLMVRYNSPALLEQAERDLMKFRGDQFGSNADRILHFMSKVSSFNRRCESGGLRFKKKQWNRNRVFDWSCSKLIR